MTNYITQATVTRNFRAVKTLKITKSRLKHRAEELLKTVAFFTVFFISPVVIPALAEILL